MWFQNAGQKQGVKPDHMMGLSRLKVYFGGKVMKRRNLIFGFVCVVLLMCTACTKKTETVSTGAKKYTVGYINMADSDPFATLRKQALLDLVKKEAPHIAIKSADANLDIQKQLDQADVFISQKVDCLILIPIDFEGTTPAVLRANEAGIPVICIGNRVSGGDHVFIGSQNVEAGVMQGELFAKLLPQNAKILYLQGTAGLDWSRDREAGFFDTLINAGRSDVTVLARMDGDAMREKGMKITEDWIQMYPQFDAVVAGNDQMALGAVEALKGANRLQGVLITGVDGVDDARNAIKNGEMTQSILQDADGLAMATLEAMKKLFNNEAVDEIIWVPFKSITVDNVDQYL
jgi:inositol transport system substrate-binding protein